MLCDSPAGNNLEVVFVANHLKTDDKGRRSSQDHMHPVDSVDDRVIETLCKALHQVLKNFINDMCCLILLIFASKCVPSAVEMTGNWPVTGNSSSTTICTAETA